MRPLSADISNWGNGYFSFHLSLLFCDEFSPDLVFPFCLGGFDLF